MTPQLEDIMSSATGPVPPPTMDMAARLDPSRYSLDAAASREWADYALSVQDQALQVAADRVTGQHVLIRSVAIDTTASPVVRRQLLRSARTAVTFHHPAILPVLEVGEADGHLIFVQPLPRAPLLHHSLDADIFSWSRAYHAAQPFLEGMAAARAAGFNVPLISPHDFVLVGKEGAESRRLIALSPLVPLGWTLQTANPLFSAPGELEDEEGNIVAAIFSTGALLTYMMAGRTPGHDENWQHVLSQLQIPAQVRPILTSMLEKEPVLRPREASHLVQWFDDIAQARPLASAFARPAHRFLLRSETLRTALLQAPALGRAHRLKAVALAVGSLPVLAFAAWAILRHPGRAHVLATTPPAPTHRVTLAQPTPVVSEPVETLEEPAASTWLVTDLRPRRQPAPVLSVPRLSQPTSRSHFEAPLPTAVLASLSLPVERPWKVTLHREDASLSTASEALAVQNKPIPRAIPVAIPVAEPFLPDAPVRINGATPPGLVLASLAPAELPSRNLRDQVAQLMNASATDAAQRANLRAQAQRLQQTGDSLGDSALGYVTLRDAEAAPRLADCRALLSRAIPLLKKATGAGQPKAAYHLIQACLNQYNLERQAGHRSAADRASRELSNVLASLPQNVPARDLGQLAGQIEHTLDLREQQGHPHPQASYNRGIANALRALAEDR